jgi:hypothetical protein
MLRKITPALFILMLTAATAFCQMRDFNKYEFGLRIAPHVSWTSPDSKGLNSDGTGLDWSFGCMVNNNLSDKYALGFELNLAFVDSRISYDSMIVDGPAGIPARKTAGLSYHYSLQYIQVPVLFKMRTSDIGALRIYGEFGLGLSFLLRSKADVGSSMNNVSISNMDVDNPDEGDKITLRDMNNFNRTYSDEVNFFRPSLIIGAGIQYKIFGSTACVGLRYDTSLRDMLADEKWKAGNNLVALNIGVLF